MGLNDLKLSPAVLTALYPASLVQPDTDPVKAPAVAGTIKEADLVPEQPELKFLGNNKKNILVVVDYENVVHLPDEELNFLGNMLAACKLNLGDVAIVNKRNTANETYKELVTNFQSRIVFLFGVDPLAFGLPVSFPAYQVQSVANTTFLYTPSLDKHRNDPLLKSKLWLSLRSIFNI